MKDNISKHDWETISAYVDGQLSEREQTRLESRIEIKPKLRIALDEMRNTRQVLRAAPRLRAPRSFMLTPEMAGQPRQLPRLAPVFGWASAVASFLFILFLVGDLFTTGGAIPMALSNVPTQEEFIAPRGQVIEDNAVAQPAADVGGLEESPSEMMEVAAPPEISEEEVALEAAAVPEIESAPKAEQEPISKADDVAAAEETETEPETIFAEREAEAGATISTDPEVRPVQGDPKDTGRNADSSETGENEFVEIASATETLEVESTPEQHLLAPPVEEAQPIENAPPPTEEVTQLPTVSAGLSEAITELSPTVEQEPIPTEIPLEGVPKSEKLSNPIIGAEVLLGLVALGAGFAWVYLRRRGS